MKAIIIDDEKRGREILLKLLQDYCPEVEVAAMAANTREGYRLIEQFHPDVVFLDVEMPNSNGFDLLEQFDEPFFQVVFTTAFEHYALKAIKHQVFDYLLKPIDIDDLKLCIEKLKARQESKPAPVAAAVMAQEKRIDSNSRLGLTVKEGIIYVTVGDILRVESDGPYSIFHTADGRKYMVSRNLKEYEEILPMKDFFRIHKSHLININKVKKYIRMDGYFVEMIDGSTVEIARRKKDEFLEAMERQNS